MARFRDQNAPAGRVVFGGEAFHDGLTTDIDPSPETLLLFNSAGIVEETGTETADSVTELLETETEQAKTVTAKPATSRKK